MNGPSYHILVAEDNPVNLRLILRILKMLNHQTDTAKDGLEVLKKLRHRPYDFILMDVQMPRLGGLETARRITASMPPSLRPTIIAMTANATIGDKEKCMASGMDDYLSKPIMIHELEQKLNAWKRNELAASAEEHAALRHIDSDLSVSWSRLQEIRNMTPDLRSFSRLLDAFATQSGQRVLDLRDSAVKRRAADIREWAHSLKGACLNFGAMEMAGLCEEIERSASSRKSFQMLERIDRLASSLEHTTGKITEWIASQSESPLS